MHGCHVFSTGGARYSATGGIHAPTALDMLKEHHRQVKTGQHGEQARGTMVYSNEWLDERGTPDDDQNFAMTTR